MCACWKQEPSERPHFERVRSILEEMLDAASADYGYVQPSSYTVRDVRLWFATFMYAGRLVIARACNTGLQSINASVNTRFADFLLFLLAPFHNFSFFS